MSITSLWNIILIVLGFGMLIGLHELGHFIAAKWSGIRTNAFAVGMGPVVFSWRSGVGITFGSSTSKIVKKYGKDASAMSDGELKEHGLSETEYSLRLLPIGGFVSMLGQEDGKPEEVSQDPRSYNMCPIGKRMVVVSAGVVMNLLLAAVLFVGCFQVGVRFEAPVIGQVIPNTPASEAVASDGTHLLSGDKVVAINGKPAATFTDIQIAGAMSKPGDSVVLEVQRAGVDQTLSFTMTPRSVSQEGLLELGLYPASSLTIPEGETGKEVVSYLAAAYPILKDLTGGSQLVDIDGKEVSTWSELDSAIQQSGGETLITRWNSSNTVDEIKITPTPSFEQFVPATTYVAPTERGLLGLCPLPLIKSVVKESPNQGLLQDGDVVIGADFLEYPRQGQLRDILSKFTSDTMPLKILRNNEVIDIQAKVVSGKLGVLLTDAWDLPIVAQPVQQVIVHGKENQTVIAGKQVLGGSTLVSLNGNAVRSWYSFRKLIDASSGELNIVFHSPILDSPPVSLDLRLTTLQYDDIRNLGWTTPLVPALFEPLYVVRSSGGNPLVAMQMGVDETVNMVVMTYLTIDRLLRRSVGVDQLRGPVGIIHIGSRIADRGISYLLFFLAIISVNLAVLNFLPLPIVDGGLFLYLLYEKFRGKPPSIGFQNAAAMLGLGMIGILFVVTFYNDILRLIG
ncbi:MAG: site-2 protease family protein [Planctomycetes bacterium]|nr:site-2 protease family protein [Planctomycetota bacterium]